MTFQFASDLHLEFSDNAALLWRNPMQPKADLLILAGDVLPLGEIDNYDWFFDYLSENFKQVYWVPGNHEFYRFDIADKSFYLHEPIRRNVHLINNKTVEWDGYRIVFSTLWTNIRDKNKAEILLRLNDFRLIRLNKMLLTPEKYNELHEASLNFVTNELSTQTNKKTIVVTHHVPTLKNYPPEYAGDALNDAFAVELSELIERTQPECSGYTDTRITTHRCLRLENAEY